jgi:hypothetical protein
MAELALIKLTRPEVTSDPDALAARIGRLERRIENLGEAPEPVPSRPRPEPASSAPAEPVVEAGAAEPETPPADEPVPSIEPAVDPAAPPLEFGQLQSVWPGLFGGLRDVLGARRWALFREVVPGGVDGSTIILHVPHFFHLEQLQADPVVEKVVATKASDLLGRPIIVRFVAPDSESGPATPDTSEDMDVDLAGEQLFEAPAGPVDLTKLLEDELGAELIDESD